MKRFAEIYGYRKGVAVSARVAINEVLGTKKDEKIIIVTNPSKDHLTISHALYDAALDAEARPVIIVQNTKGQLDYAEDSVIKAMESRPDIIISISEEKLGKDRYRLAKPIRNKYAHIFEYLLYTKKIRAFWCPGITLEMFEKTIPINYKVLRQRAKKLKRILDRADEVHITSPSGTDITIGLKKRKAFVDDGDFTKPGRGGNLPCGEVFISPALGKSEGKIVYDGSISSDRGEIIIRNPITVYVRNGYISRITGKNEARLLRETIKRAVERTKEMVREGKLSPDLGDEYIKNTGNLGELGIGLNEKAKIVGNMLEDEKVYGTCHIAIGANYDNDARCLIHLDGIIMKPTIVATVGSTEKKIMDNGKIVV
ncbi:MAG: hypothetical protein DRN20_01330 [Thermoplasmata archaeon]|nr:MAG: hypothetical protein DRN20_01330 [Thermoplasmata archaeon]